MAYGSMAGARAYANKVFEIEDSLARLEDGRSNPTTPLLPILLTWFWAFTRRLPSTEQVGDLLKDKRWRRRVGLAPEDGGSPDTAARALDELSIVEVNELLLDRFFVARRAGLLDSGGPFGLRCAIVDLNELFSSQKRHCAHCQVRKEEIRGQDGVVHEVEVYFHQAVTLVWAGGEMVFPLGWELLAPGEGELTAALRLLTRLLPRLSHTVDLVLGDGLYACRPFIKLVLQHGLHPLAISSGQTEMDQELDLLVENEPGSRLQSDVQAWEMESTAWEKDIGQPLRLLHFQRLYPAKPWKKERSHLRFLTTAKVDVMPTGQGWKVGRHRWKIENGTFNLLTRDYSLEHNYRHSPAAIVALLCLRSLALCFTAAYHRHAIARSRSAPKDLLRWFLHIFQDDWVRYLDAALRPATPDSG
jgi:hypothetical protein